MALRVPLTLQRAIKCKTGNIDEQKWSQGSFSAFSLNLLHILGDLLPYWPCQELILMLCIICKSRGRERTSIFPDPNLLETDPQHVHISKRFIHEGADWESFLFSDGQSSCNLHLQADPHHITNIITIINSINITTFVINEWWKEAEQDLDYIEGRKEGIFEMVWYRGDVGVGVRKLFFNTYWVSSMPGKDQ